MRRCEVCFAPLPAWEDAYLWPCAHGGLTVCADCFDTLVGGLSRRELGAPERTGSVRGTEQQKPAHTVGGRIMCGFSSRC